MHPSPGILTSPKNEKQNSNHAKEMHSVLSAARENNLCFEK